jgi:putative hydrolase of HD superfamily
MIPPAWIEDLLQLKRIRRTGWLGVGVDRPESVADHCFAMALLAWRLAREQPGLDASRVLVMALLHDFHEARLTDIPTPAKKYLPDGAIEEAERRIAAEQWADDPDGLALLAEFQRGETEEAKLARAVDHLEFLYQADAYRAGGRPLTERMLRRARNGPAWEHPATRPLAERLLAKLEVALPSDGPRG